MSEKYHPPISLGNDNNYFTVYAKTEMQATAKMLSMLFNTLRIHKKENHIGIKHQLTSKQLARRNHRLNNHNPTKGLPNPEPLELKQQFTKPIEEL